jgi:F-type H+-transporting ATPase subunit epsilon
VIIKYITGLAHWHIITLSHSFYMTLEILTPEKKLFSGEVYGIQLPGTVGLFELLDKHAPMVSSLSKGTIKILKDKTATESYAIESGFVEMINNKATVLVEGVAE